MATDGHDMPMTYEWILEQLHHLEMCAYHLGRHPSFPPPPHRFDIWSSVSLKFTKPNRSFVQYRFCPVFTLFWLPAHIHPCCQLSTVVEHPPEEVKANSCFLQPNDWSQRVHHIFSQPWMARDLLMRGQTQICCARMFQFYKRNFRH